MTIQHAAGTRQLMRLHRGKRLCNTFEVTRRDGFVLRFCDHDRTLTVNGEAFAPINLISLSAEQRDAALREGNMEARGFVDGVQLTIPDLLGGLYRGATVRHAIVDWTMPWHEHYAVRKRIRQMHWDGSTWTATLEGMGARLQQLVGGRFSGTTSQTCPYKLGDNDSCKADLTFDTIAAAAVQTVNDDKWDVEFTTASWAGTFVDDYYRDGELEWTAGDNVGTISPIASYVHSTRRVELFLPTPFPIQVGDTAIARPGCDGLKTTCGDKFGHIFYTGTATAGGATTLTDSGAAWPVNAFAPNAHTWRVGITAGTGAGQTRNIASNTGTVLTVSAAWTTNPDATSAYRILRPNILNFGGSPYDPGARGVLELPT